ncbi:MAG: hypothetical protein ACYTFT_17220 [Planctomycetota bacterium]|jgi:hypothetical protein
MSTDAIRGLLLVLNLALVGLIGWTAYSTFFAADESRWQVERLDVKKFRPPVIEEDPHRQNEQIYQTISKVFQVDPPKEAPVVDNTPVTPPPPPVGDPKNLKVELLVFDPEEPQRSSVWLAPSGRGSAHTFTIGMSLDTYKDFSRYKKVTVKSITQDKIVLDHDGKDVVLSRPGAPQ